MKLKILPKFTYFIYILFTSLLLSQPGNESFESKVETLISEMGFSNSIIGIDIYNLTDSAQIYQRNNMLLMRPASNAKILTSSAALLFLGEDYNFETTVYKVGEIKDSILFGSVFIKGGFDPTFSSDDLDTLLLKVKQAGINEIRGNIFLDISAMDSLSWGSGWMWDDDPSTDAPRLSPLCINHNSIKIIVTPGFTGGKATIKLIPETDYFKIENHSLTTDTTSKLKVTRDWLNNSDKIIVSGTINTFSEPDTTEINVSNLTKYFKSILMDKINRNGIILRGICDTLTTLFYADSLFSNGTKYADIIKELNKKSDNLYAEMTLRALGMQYFGNHSSAMKGLKMVDRLVTLAAGNSVDYKMVDGSGLSHYNLLTNNLLLSVIKFLFYNHPLLYTILKNSLPVSGTDGTLEYRLQGDELEGKVFAKTGSLSAVSTITGIIESPDGDEIAFSIFVNNYTKKGSYARFLQDRIIEMIGEISFK